MDFVGVEGEVERRAFAYLALGPGAAPVPFHDLPDAGQADTCAGKLAGRMQPLERHEQRAHVNGVKAGTVVAQVAADGGISCRRGAELDQRMVPARGELPGVLDQIPQECPDERGICPDIHRALDNKADVPAWLLALKLSGDVVDLGAEVDGLQVHGGPGGLGENQQVLDEHGYFLAGDGDSLGVAPALLAESVRALFQQHFAVSS
jgi:hypothetical protein